jgi:hypothetical protein
MESTHVFEMSNRYFMLKKDTLMEKSMPFGSDIDPKGILNCAAGNSYIHSEQNRVLSSMNGVTPSDK